MRVLVPRGTARPGKTLLLEAEEAHHLRVRRAEPGEEVELRDGAGLAGTGVLEAGGRGWAVMVVSAVVHPPPSPLTLAVGGGDRERFLWLVEKAAELGVSRIIPLETERTAGVATRVRTAHVDRLARRAREATKQSGGYWTPEIGAPEPFAAFMSRTSGGARWLADTGGDVPDVPEGEVTVLVGPEGGLSASERAAAVAAGWTPVSLGANVLRFETAALAAAAHIAIDRQRRA